MELKIIIINGDEIIPYNSTNLVAYDNPLIESKMFTIKSFHLW